MSWKKRALIFFVLYSFDMSIAIAGFTWGFGVAVKSWLVVVGLMLVSRFAFHILNQVMWMGTAARKDQERRGKWTTRDYSGDTGE